MVGGDAGVGKTRLLAEFTGTLDAVVLRGGCLPLGATGLPFSPIVEVLRALADDGLPPVLARLVPGLSAQASPGLSSQAELFQAFLGLLERLAAARTVVLVLEDLHWADRSTRQLLAFVAHALRSQRLCVVATYRADDLHRQHPLRPLLAELRRNRRARRVELAPFAPAEYLAAATGSRPAPETVAAVVDRTEGNAYFIEELIAADGLGGRPLPESFRDLLVVRVEALGPPARRLLRVVSAAGRRFDPSLLAAVSGLPQPEVVELLREAVDRLLLSPTAAASASGMPCSARRSSSTFCPGSGRPSTPTTPWRWNGPPSSAPPARPPPPPSSPTTGTGRRPGPGAGRLGPGRAGGGADLRLRRGRPPLRAGPRGVGPGR
ncbi:MAG TPA: AAA family ATPase, partial [Actinomycetes bacterium]|nr:AAA family ATPase [Actinomycetes bacterium]